MKKIPSFEKDHNLLQRGFYECGTAHGVTTFDLRFKIPNGGDYIDQKALHTIEHLLATVLRNSEHGDDIIYFGPMGCRTGFYMLTVNLSFSNARKLLASSLKTALTLEEIPGAKKEECGNFAEHDLKGAKKEIKEYLELLCNL